MNDTGFQFDNKALAALSIGCMRFPGRKAAAEVIHTCLENGVRYLDTSPMYCYQNEDENNETWVGDAIRGIREEVILSAKSSTGNGGNQIGEYNPKHGFSITAADQVLKVIDQSLRRLNVEYFDVYQLWAAHTMEIYNEALKKGGWLEGVLKARERGLFRHLGITSHAGNEELIHFIDSGMFETITVPFHIMDISRLEAIRHARDKGMSVIAMNPLAGGFLGSGSSELLHQTLIKYGIESLPEMALRFCNAFGVSALSGMTSAEQARQNCAAVSKPRLEERQALALHQEFKQLLHHESFTCTGCGYCMPCPRGINIPDVLRSRNHYTVLGIKEAEHRLKEWHRWNEGYKIEKCNSCGACENRCPNGVKVRALFREIISMR